MSVKHLFDGFSTGEFLQNQFDSDACACHGKRFTIATHTDDHDELRKRFLSLAIAGERMGPRERLHQTLQQLLTIACKSGQILSCCLLVAFGAPSP